MFRKRQVLMNQFFQKVGQTYFHTTAEKILHFLNEKVNQYKEYQHQEILLHGYIISIKNFYSRFQSTDKSFLV